MIKTTPTPWKIVPVRDGDKSLFFLKDGKNCNITHDMFAYNSDWWDYFNHAVHCVNKMPEAIKSFHIVVRKLEELITSDGFGYEVSSFDLLRLKEYCEETLDRIDYGDKKKMKTLDDIKREIRNKFPSMNVIENGLADLIVDYLHDKGRIVTDGYAAVPRRLLEDWIDYSYIPEYRVDEEYPNLREETRMIVDSTQKGNAK